MGHADRRLSTIHPAFADQLASASVNTQRHVATEIAEFVARSTGADEMPTVKTGLTVLRDQGFGDEATREKLDKLASESLAAITDAADAGDDRTGRRMTEVYHAILAVRAALAATSEKAVLAAVYEAFGADGETAKNVKARVRELINNAEGC